jgi:SnoaL-like domain
VQFDGLDAGGARELAERWLPAWTGNDPERLASFYTEDAFYSDPAIPDGVQGRDALTAYFRKLLGRNPDWVWEHEGSIPLEGGFVNRWRATIPAGDTQVVCRGVCTVQLRNGLIARNEVFFDRSSLLAAING